MTAVSVVELERRNEGQLAAVHIGTQHERVVDVDRPIVVRVRSGSQRTAPTLGRRWPGWRRAAAGNAQAAAGVDICW